MTSTGVDPMAESYRTKGDGPEKGEAMQGACAWSPGVCRPGPEQGEPRSGLGLAVSRDTAQGLWPPKHVSRGVWPSARHFASVMM